jgi:hypothetical protein
MAELISTSVILPSISVKHFIFSSWLSLSSAILENIFHVINDSQMGLTKKARTSDHMFILKTIIDKYCKGFKLSPCFTPT